MAIEVRTQDLPQAERFAFWREVTAQMVAPVDVRSEHAADFRASACLVDLGTVQLSVAHCPSYEARRSSRLIRRSDPELFQLSFNLRGHSGVSQARREVMLRDDEFVLYDTSHPFVGWAVPEADAAEGVLVAFPRSLLSLPAQRVDTSVPVRLSGDAGVGALLARIVREVPRHVDKYSVSDIARLSVVLVDLISALVAHHFESSRMLPPETHRRVLLMGIHAFVEQNLGDPELSPAAIAASNHISVRYLHMLFQQQGMTVSDWIRERRLACCRRDLADPALGGWTIQAIAARWGFADPASFSRIFRRAHGMTPIDYRRSAMAADMRPPAGPAPSG